MPDVPRVTQLEPIAPDAAPKDDERRRKTRLRCQSLDVVRVRVSSTDAGVKRDEIVAVSFGASGNRDRFFHIKE